MASEVFSKEDVEELATQLLDSNGDSLGGDKLGKRSLEDAEAELPDSKKAKEAMGNITCEDPADIGVDAGMCAGGVPGTRVAVKASTDSTQRSSWHSWMELPK